MLFQLLYLEDSLHVYEGLSDSFNNRSRLERKWFWGRLGRQVSVKAMLYFQYLSFANLF